MLYRSLMQTTKPCYTVWRVHAASRNNSLIRLACLADLTTSGHRGCACRVPGRRCVHGGRRNAARTLLWWNINMLPLRGTQPRPLNELSHENCWKEASARLGSHEPGEKERCMKQDVHAWETFARENTPDNDTRAWLLGTGRGASVWRTQVVVL